MGFAIAEILAEQGGKVILITGPTYLNTVHTGIKRVNIVSAGDMYKQCVKYFSSSDAVIMSAAVADFTPLQVSSEKIKNKDSFLTIDLQPTKDILKELGKRKKYHQRLIGFALETNQEMENAVKKMKEKNLDFIVLNTLKDEHAGFGHDTNKVTIIDKNNITKKYELKSKREVARDIIFNLIEVLP